MTSIVWIKRGDWRSPQGVCYVLKAPHENPIEAANRHISENPADKNAALAIVHEECE